MKSTLKAKFLNDLIVQRLKGKTWEVLQDFKYQTPIINGVVKVPSGFVTDFASVPRLPIVYFLTGNTAHKAAVIHDYLYRTHICNRRQADRIFKEAMKLTGVPGWRRFLMYSALRLCAAGTWKKVYNPKRLHYIP